MTISRRFHSWQTHEARPEGFDHCSPALTQLGHDLAARWPVTVLGCYGVRPIRGGSVISTHAFGAALDVSFGPAGFPEARDQMIGYCIAWSEEWALQAVHDYRGQRIWRAGRTANPADACSRWWRAQRRDSNGMGQVWANWLHLEVHPDGWHDARSAAERGVL